MLIMSIGETIGVNIMRPITGRPEGKQNLCWNEDGGSLEVMKIDHSANDNMTLRSISRLIKYTYICVKYTQHSCLYLWYEILLASAA